MLRSENLSVGYGKKVLIDGINLNLEKGKIITLIGPNGSGKSTVLKTILGEIKRLGGKISIAGRDFDSLSEKDLSTRLSMVLTERINPLLMTVKEVVQTGRYPYTGRLGLLGKEDEKAVSEALEITKCLEIQDKPFCSLSDGQKQRVMLSRAICQDTDIIVLDEPTSFLDLYYKLDLMKIVLRLVSEKKKCVLMSLHELDIAKSVSDYVICVDGKKVVKNGRPDEIFFGDFIQKLFGLEKDDFDSETCVLNLKSTRDWNGREAVTEQSEVMEADAGTMESPAGSGASGGALKKKKHAKVIMVQGTMSSAGKSLLVAGLCRVFKQDGFRVAPFKSQNMALNSFVTKEGLEMGRAQVMQAEACGIEPLVCMNPVLLKPTNDRGSQVIVNGEVIGNMEAREYFKMKKSLVPEILKAFEKLEEEADIIVIEGAGSPAEINLKENDIVNMGLAELLDAPVLLVGDIDRGGVFAQLLGTISLLEEKERSRVKGLVINKFRGDKSILDPGIKMLEERAGIPVTGVLPYLHLSIDDEDSLTGRFGKKEKAKINIAVVKFPRISNFSDFSVFETIEDVRVHYISEASEIEKMDMVILPGSKNTLEDLIWLRESGLEAMVKKYASSGGVVFGLCGGFQMLGKSVSDPEGVESSREKGKCIRGLELLDFETFLENKKKRSQVYIELEKCSGIFKVLSGKKISGYEIHMGKTFGKDFKEGLSEKGNVYGSYIHGFFDEGTVALDVCRALSEKKGIKLSDSEGAKEGYKAFKESQYDKLARAVREYLDIEAVYGILKEADF